MTIAVSVITFIFGVCAGVLLSCLIISRRLNKMDDDVVERIKRLEELKNDKE